MVETKTELKYKRMFDFDLLSEAGVEGPLLTCRSGMHGLCRGIYTPGPGTRRDLWAAAIKNILEAAEKGSCLLWILDSG